MRLLMATRHFPGDPPEAEPVTLEVEGDELTLVLDDGEILSFHLPQFQAELDAESHQRDRELA